MALTIKLPTVVTVANDEGYEIDQLIFQIKQLAGVKVRKKSLDKGYGSSQCDWILFTKKDAKYIKLLEKQLGEE